MVAGTGLVFVDLAGTQALFPSERGLLTALEARLDGVARRRPVGRGDEQALHARERSLGLFEAHGDAELLLALPDLRDGLAAERGLDDHLEADPFPASGRRRRRDPCR